MTKFMFDLDGTITQEETLPLIARHFGVREEIESLTAETVAGRVPFVESFIRRVHILGRFPVAEVADLLAGVKLYPQVLKFIAAHSDSSLVVTGNLDCWVERLLSRLACPGLTSKAQVKQGRVAKIDTILQKEKVVTDYQAKGYKVVFIGDGMNDAEAMRLSDVSIASGLTHSPAVGVLTAADYLAVTEEALCRQLKLLS